MTVDTKVDEGAPKQTVKFVIAGMPDLHEIHRSAEVDFANTTGVQVAKQVFAAEIAEGWTVRLFASGRPVRTETLAAARVPPDSFLHAFLAKLPPKLCDEPIAGVLEKQVPVAQPPVEDDARARTGQGQGQQQGRHPASRRTSQESRAPFIRRIMFCCFGVGAVSATTPT
ncbi:unnamed protein product [Amoebophrya sp. A120]|nr:unnamed protein product [Amoebophrya sp. A120]|eukprot:GSA120T00018055001.1